MRQLPEAPWLTVVHERTLDRLLPARLLWQWLVLHRRAARAGCDVLFVPGGSYAGPFHPFVTMSRNLLPFEDDERRRYGISRMGLKLAMLRRGQVSTMRRADGTVFLTSYARTAVTAVTGPLGGRTALIPHGIGPEFMRPPRVQLPAEAFGSSRPFRLLYVSTIDLYKHQDSVAEAVATLHARGLPVVVTFVGAAYPPALVRLRTTIARVDPRGTAVIHAGPVAHDLLPTRYHEADAFVFASSCENMPNILIEAMAAGLPIACANRGPMPDILGDAGLYFEPDRASSIAACLERLFRDDTERAALAARSFARAQQFSWRRCAADTLQFLARVHADRARAR
jgi:glycosyltransferase involved in cell wall biosynthesis